jgi:hypothetical protein
MSAPVVPDRFYKLQEVAELLGVSLRVLRAQATRGEFEHIRISEYHVLLTPEQFQKLIASRTRAAKKAVDPLERDRQRVVRQRSGNTRRGAKAAA